MPSKKSKTLYYSLEVCDSGCIVNILKNNIQSDEIDDLVTSLENMTLEENTFIHKDNKYRLNGKYHVTMLYVGRKYDEHETEYDAFLNDDEHDIIVERIGINEDFITFGVKLPNNIPYYGNEIQHITVGIKISDKKLLAKDSASALLDTNIITLIEPIVIKSKMKKISA